LALALRCRSDYGRRLILKDEQLITWRLGYAPTPLAISAFFGLLALTLSLLKAEYITVVGIPK